MVLVVIESPLKGAVPAWVTRWVPRLAPLFERVGRYRNRAYARACARDALLRGEAAYASHVHYDLRGVLDDAVPLERKLGMEAGFAWGERAQLRAVYLDRGLSEGMRLGIAKARELGQEVEYRALDLNLKLQLRDLMNGNHGAGPHALEKFLESMAKEGVRW